MRYRGYKPLIITLISLALLAGSYFFGYTVGHENLKFDKSYRPAIVNKDLGKPNDIDFALFWEVWQKVKDHYAGEINNQEMVYDAINGALRSLDDPYTLFLPPDEAKRFNDDLKGSFEGVGAEIEKRSGAITVIAPLEGSPAEKAGLKPKDIILKIDGAETTDMSLDEAVGKIRGKSGTVVKLVIIREGAGEPLEVSITRGTIVVKSVKWEMKEGNIGYIKLNQFGEDTRSLMDAALNEMSSKKPKGVVLDVRNNPGGFLDTAIDITSLFLAERGAIVKEKDKSGQLKELKATSKAKFTETPMVVIMNGGSASASEILAGALADYGRAKTVGEKTFGKGSVQELSDVAGGSAVRITVAQWLTPKGRQINKEGLRPDIEVKLTEEDEKNKRDPQLERAMAELK